MSKTLLMEVLGPEVPPQRARVERQAVETPAARRAEQVAESLPVEESVPVGRMLLGLAAPRQMAELAEMLAPTAARALVGPVSSWAAWMRP